MPFVALAFFIGVSIVAHFAEKSAIERHGLLMRQLRSDADQRDKMLHSLRKIERYTLSTVPPRDADWLKELEAHVAKTGPTDTGL